MLADKSKGSLRNLKRPGLPKHPIHTRRSTWEGKVERVPRAGSAMHFDGKRSSSAASDNLAVFTPGKPKAQHREQS